MRVVAHHADWWNLPNVSPSTFRHKNDVLRGHCSRIGRNPAEIVKSLANMVAIAETAEKARALASNSPFVNMEREENYIVGDADEVAEKVSEYTRLGIEHFILRFIDFPRTDGAKLFARNVIPRFA